MHLIGLLYAEKVRKGIGSSVLQFKLILYITSSFNILIAGTTYEHNFNVFWKRTYFRKYKTKSTKVLQRQKTIYIFSWLREDTYWERALKVRAADDIALVKTLLHVLTFKELSSSKYYHYYYFMRTGHTLIFTAKAVAFPVILVS